MVVETSSERCLCFSSAIADVFAHDTDDKTKAWKASQFRQGVVEEMLEFELQLLSTPPRPTLY